jgi:hypothetical protein
MGSLPDGYAKCCQIDALARQRANAFEHAIWNCMWRIDTVGLGAAGRWQAGLQEKEEIACTRPWRDGSTTFVCVRWHGHGRSSRNVSARSLPRWLLCPSIQGASSHGQPFGQGRSNSIGFLDEYAPSCERAWHTDALSRLLIPVCVTSHSTHWRRLMSQLQRRENEGTSLVAVKELV